MRFLLAWILYGLGAFFGWLTQFDQETFSWYPIYNRLMGWSEGVQGPSINGPWGEISPEYFERLSQDANEQLGDPSLIKIKSVITQPKEPTNEQ